MTPLPPYMWCFIVFTYVQTCPEVSTSALDTVEKWEEVCRQTCIQAAFVRVAALWAEEVTDHANEGAQKNSMCYPLEGDGSNVLRFVLRTTAGNGIIFVARLTTTTRACHTYLLCNLRQRPSRVGCNVQEDEVLLMADARAEETARKAEAMLKKQRQQEIKEAERDAAEMADLMANDPEVRYASITARNVDGPKIDETVWETWTDLCVDDEAH